MGSATATGTAAAEQGAGRRTSMPVITSDVWQYRGLVADFARRELKGKYKGSVLGSIWALVNPLATLAIYSLVFGFFLRFTPPVAGNGTLQSFPVYLFTGLVVWNFFLAVATGSMQALIGAGPLLRKIYFPPFAPVIGNAVATTQQIAIELALLLVVFVVALNVGWTVLMLPVLLVLLAAFSLGVGLFLSMLNARLRDINYIVQVVFNLLFYAAPIIYPIAFVTDRYDEHPWLRVYEFNPITSFVEAFRAVLYHLEMPPFWQLGYLTVISFGMLVLGWRFFQSRAADVSEDL
jgi:ABC-type polysaccharide/polyol phosphate export permease